MIGSTILHYRIVRKLGHGGMGEVFLAEDTNLRRQVAIKFLSDAFAGDPERLARFTREARALAALAPLCWRTIGPIGQRWPVPGRPAPASESACPLRCLLGRLRSKGNEGSRF